MAEDTKRLRFTKEGSVVRITLKNFMTYKNESIFPGPNFNVTVGPNGSGKSSIVTALCIALGGDLKSLNRQQDLQSLINNNCGNQAAVIEIELFSEKGNNTVVKCMIKNNATEPSWLINGKNSTKDKLLILTDRYQIQPGNMCQFLPQDVVRQFPQMKPPEIFENTLKAVGNQDMLEKLHQGAKIQDSMEGINEDIKTKENTMSSLEQREKRMEDQLRRLEEQEKMEEKKSIVEKALAWERFYIARKTAKETREKKRELDAKKSKLEEELQVHKEFLVGYNNKVENIKKNIENCEQEFRKKGDLVERALDISQLEEQIEHLDSSEKDLDNTEKDRIKQKKNLQKEITEFKKYLETEQWSANDEEHLRKIRNDRTTRNEQLSNNDLQVEEVDLAIKMGQRDMDRLKREYQSLVDQKDQKLSVLQKENPDAYSGVMWLRQNRHKFNKTVHEPIMLVLDVKNRNFVKILELHIGRADLEGFVCEDVDDMNFLLTELRERMKLRKINVFHSEAHSKEAFRKPYSYDQLQKYGFLGYLSDAYDAPDAINAYLCQQKNLHEVPVFEKEIENVTDELKTRFRNYYIGNYKVSAKVSRYSKEISTGTHDISSQRVIRLDVSTDKSSIDNILTEIKAKEAFLKNSENRKKQRLKVKEKLLEELQKIEDNYKELDKSRKEIKSKEHELKMKEEMLRNLAEPKVNVDAQKKKIRNEKVDLVRKLCRQVQSNLRMIERCGDLDLLRTAHQLQLQNVEGENQDSNYKVKDLEKDYNVISEQLAEIDAKFSSESKDIKKVHEEAKSATDGFQDAGCKYRPPLEWQEKFKEDNLNTMDINQLKAIIEDYEDCIKRSAVKPDTRRKIEEEREKMIRAKQDLQNLRLLKEERINQLEMLRRDWISGVKSLVSDVDEKFSEMMAGLGYSGQVELQEGLDNDTLDMKNYGIRILVKFRSGDDFVELTKGTQSGGEKSVTTAVYMMALQGLTQVPFRCVDEINQGMDETNERSVWDMLLEVCKEHQAQYFYMAPKFPYNLPFNNQVTILICNSGRVNSKSDKDFSIKHFVQVSRNI